MSRSTKKAAEQMEKEKVQKRYSNRREPDVIYPAKKQADFYDEDVHQRVAVYVRVSTDNLGQETSYVLQKNYYEEFVLKHPNWTLVKIYADKGISGTSTKHRDELNQMLADCRVGKIDLIITKSVSRLARNTVDCITMVRNLAELRNPVGVFFESECIFSLNEDTSMPLSFLATIAENESRIRSRSMEVSLAQRLNGGLPLTPKLLGYSHDTEGNLVINPDEAPTVRLIFYMYLSGYSSSHIAKTLEELGILALRPCAESERDAFAWCNTSGGKRRPRQVTGKFFFAKLFELMGWNLDYRYKLLGKVIHANGEYLIAFDLNATEIYQRIAKDGGKPKTARIPVFPAGWKDQFGLPYHEHQKSLQINIFDGYAIYGIKDNTVSAVTVEDHATSAQEAGLSEAPVQEESGNG